mgnify:CR=1 FL=1
MSPQQPTADRRSHRTRRLIEESPVGQLLRGLPDPPVSIYGAHHSIDPTDPSTPSRSYQGPTKVLPGHWKALYRPCLHYSSRPFLPLVILLLPHRLNYPSVYLLTPLAPAFLALALVLQEVQQQRKITNGACSCPPPEPRPESLAELFDVEGSGGVHRL